MASKVDSYSSGEEDIPLFKRGARLTSNGHMGESVVKENSFLKTPSLKTSIIKTPSSKTPVKNIHSSNNQSLSSFPKKTFVDRLSFRETEIRPHAMTPETYRPSILEPCTVGQSTCNLPFEIFNLPDLSGILSMDTWKNVLSEEERSSLLPYLPSSSQTDTDSTLEELFSCANLNFGSPLLHFSLQLRSGLYHPNVSCYLDGLKLFQQRQHYHFVRQYHNSMVNSWLDMKKLWQAFPDADLNTKLQEWKALKDNKPKPFSRFGQEVILHPFHSGNDVTACVEHEQRGELESKVDASDKHALTLSVPKRKRSGIESSAANAIHPPPSKKISTDPSKPTKESSDGSADVKRETQLAGKEVLQSQSSKTFSALHVLSSVRAALLREKETSDLHWVALTDIVNYVRKHPGEPRVMRAKEGIPLLSKTALRVLQSKAPPGTRLWKPFVQQRRGGQEWAWCGPVPSQEQAARRCQVDAIAWGLTAKALAKLRERFREMLASAVAAEETMKFLPKPPESGEKGFKSPKGESKRSSATPQTKDAGAENLKVRIHTPKASEKKEKENRGKSVSTSIASASATAVAPISIAVSSPLSASPSPSPSASASAAIATASVTAVRNSETVAPVASIADTHASEEVDIMDSLSDDMDDTHDPSQLIYSQYSLKSQITLPPITYEMRRQFRREERSRYSNPEKTFYYTAIDGSKSIVAPVKRSISKAVMKARDHAMLKPNRPAHVTILCLVRDSAARLPHGVGTRADVCVLIRDSQYFVEDTPDTQVNQIVSGAMDRLHYERDPCVRYDSERKLWVYLHRNRSPPDFVVDGTKSARLWNKKKGEGGNGGGSGSGSGSGNNGNEKTFDHDLNENLESISVDGVDSHSHSDKSKEEEKGEEEVDVDEKMDDGDDMRTEEELDIMEEDSESERRKTLKEFDSKPLSLKKRKSVDMKKEEVDDDDNENGMYSRLEEDQRRKEPQGRGGERLKREESFHGHGNRDYYEHVDMNKDMAFVDFEEEYENKHMKKRQKGKNVFNYDSSQSMNGFNNIHVMNGMMNNAMDMNSMMNDSERTVGMLEPYGHIPPSQFFGGSNLILPSKHSTIPHPLPSGNWNMDNNSHRMNGFSPVVPPNAIHGNVYANYAATNDLMRMQINASNQTTHDQFNESSD